MKRVHPRLLLGAAFAAAALSFSCLGGTGTDTENGVDIARNLPPGAVAARLRVADSSGLPLAGVQLRMRPPLHRPDTGAGENPLLDPEPLATGTGGLAVARLRFPGEYVLEGRWMGLTLLLDTLRVASTRNEDTLHFRAPRLRTLKGSLRLASGFRVDTGVVFLRGTSLLSPLGADGAFDLGIVPVRAESMAIGLRYRARPRDTSFVLVRPDSARPGFLRAIASPLMASALQNAPVCLDSLPEKILAPADTAGSLPLADSALAEAARIGCGGRVGHVVQVWLADAQGRAMRLLGTRVLADVARNAGISPQWNMPAALPAGCVLSSGETLRVLPADSYVLRSALADEILIHDVAQADSCQSP